jgi:hypothetical protein
MIGDLYFSIRRLSAGIVMALMAGNALQAQGTGNPQNCSNTDPGSNTGDVGCVSFTYHGEPVTYTTVRAGDGNIWLQQNLGSSQVATLMNDENSYGDLFQWGRWDDGHQLRDSPVIAVPQVNTPEGLTGINSFVIGSPGWWNANAQTDEWTANNVAEITASIGADPCKAIGPGWKLPYQFEWAEVVNTEGISNPATAYASHLKLPAGGYRSSSTGDFTFVGQRGYFWSSDISTLGGKYLYIGTTIANPSAGAMKGQGASVRCMKPASSLSTSEVKLKIQSVGIYPNPVKDLLTVKADSAIETISVTNVAGQRMNVGLSNNQINMNGLPSGFYMIELKLKNGQSISKKVIKD